MTVTTDLLSLRYQLTYVDIRLQSMWYWQCYVFFAKLWINCRVVRRYSYKAFRTIEIAYDHVHSFIRHEISFSNISRTVLTRIAKLYTNILIDIDVYSHTGYCVTVNFRPEVIAKKTVENTASDGFGGICRERFKLASRNFTHLSKSAPQKCSKRRYLLPPADIYRGSKNG